MKKTMIHLVQLSCCLPVFTITVDAALGARTIASEVERPGCGIDPPKSGVYAFDQGEVTRTFRLHVPKTYHPDTASPAVIYFHGWGGNEEEFAGNDMIQAEADRRGYILVAGRGIGSGEPDNSFNSWSFSGSTSGLDGDGIDDDVPGDSDAICDSSMTGDYSYSSCDSIKSNTCSWTQCQVDDVDFVVELVAEIKSRLCIDEERVFAMGGSNGGMFTWELAQNPKSAHLFRAIAPVIGLPHRGYLSPHARDGDMPAILITGMKDDTVPPGDWDDAGFTTTSNGSDRYYYTGATAITRVWAQEHGCDTSTDAIGFDDGYHKPDCRSYCSKDAGWPRVLDCRADMGHTYDYDWSWKLVLDFFDAHPPARAP